MDGRTAKLGAALAGVETVQVSKAIGCSRQHAWRLRTGLTPVSPDQATQIVRALWPEAVIKGEAPKGG